MEGKTQQVAAAAAGMSVRTARTWQRGPLPSERKAARTWRTRPYPFASIWSEAVEPLLRRDPKGALQATTILEWLEEGYPGQFSPAQLRSLQRRLRDWRALHGPEQEVFFPQVHPPGREAQLDFTDAGELRVTIAGQPFAHRFFEFILSHSGWRFVDLAFGETLRRAQGRLYEALQKGLQGAAAGPGRGAPGGPQRQPLGGHPRAAGNQRTHSQPALRRPAGALRPPSYPNQPQVVPRERGGGAGPLPAQDRSGPGPAAERQPGFPHRGGLQCLRPGDSG